MTAVAQTTELTPRPQFDLAMPVFTLAKAKERRDLLVDFTRSIMRKDVDYGEVPGTDRPTLLKPGAEKLATFFGLRMQFELVQRTEDWSGKEHGGEPFFYYLYRCSAYRNDVLIAEADGSANSWEKKYRWRWVKDLDVPAHLDKSRLATRPSSLREPKFAVKKRETGGKYGKPDAYWDRFQKAIDEGKARETEVPKREGNGTMAYWEIDDTVYRVPNEDVADQVNTLQKMAQKRALVAAILLAVNASEFYTQDVEDSADSGDRSRDEKQRAKTRESGDEAEYQTLPDGQPDLAHDKTFWTEWNHVSTQQRKLNSKRAANFLAAASKKHGDKSATAAWRGDILNKLAAGTFDDAINGKPKAAGESSPAQEATAAEHGAKGKETGDAVSVTGSTEAPAPLPAVDELADYDTFYAYLCDAFPLATPEDVTLAIQNASKRLRKKPEDVTADMRMRWLRAAQAGLFAVPSGELMTGKEAVASA